jgi:predicted phage terminase large subunit-like protein
MSDRVDELKERLRREIHERRSMEESERLSGSFRDFVREAWKEVKKNVIYSHNWHIDAICEHLVGVSIGEIKRLQIWVPPVSMKSLTVSVLWPAWEWTFNPWMRYWGASYETRLAGRLAATSRNLITSEWYQARWPVSLIRDAEHYFENDQGGTRLATSPESTGTGEHGDRILIDDPLSAQQAEATSKANLTHVNEIWYDGTVSTRGTNENHARIIIMQRLHENDLAAYVLGLEDWTVLCLPERFEHNHPYAWRGKRQDIQSLGSTFGGGDPRMIDGELLWPTHRPDEVSDAIRKSLRHRYAGQQQQRPAAREGQLLMRSWWRFYPPRLMEDETRRPRCHMVCQTVDTPLKDKESNDLVSIQAWGVKGADRYLLDVRTDHMNYSKCKRAIKEQAAYVRKLFPRARHVVLIENRGYGVELIVDLKRELTGVTKIDPSGDGDKVMRAEAASDDLESGNCWLPGLGGGADESLGPAKVISAEISEFIESCATFPNAAHDDDVDAYSQAMNYLRGRLVKAGRVGTIFRQRRVA